MVVVYVSYLYPNAFVMPVIKRWTVQAEVV